MERERQRGEPMGGRTRRGPWEVRGSREVYRDRFMRVRRDEVVQPDGRPGTYAVVEQPLGVAVVALTDDGRVYLVGQHRYAIDRYSWEVPTGATEEGEDALAGARWELQEETGLRAARWAPLGDTHPPGSTCDAVVHLYLAQDLAAGQAAPEGSEQLTVEAVPLPEALRRAQADEITHAPTLVALFRTAHRLGRHTPQDESPDGPTSRRGRD